MPNQAILMVAAQSSTTLNWISSTDELGMLAVELHTTRHERTHLQMFKTVEAQNIP